MRISGGIKGSDRQISDRLYRVLAKHPPLSRKAEGILLKKAQEGDRRARDTMVLRNLRFVYKVAAKYLGQGLEFEDLLSAGVIGLIESINKFDTSSSHKFITYSVWWIRNAIQKSLFNTSRLVRISAEEERKLRKLWLTQTTMRPVINGWTLDREDLSKKLGIAEDRVDDLLKLESNRSITVINKSPDKELQNIPSEANGPDTSTEFNNISEQIQEMISHLDQDEQTVLRSYYGLNGQAETSISELTQSVGLSRETVRQIKIRAMEKMKLMCEERDMGPLAMAAA